MRLPGPWPVTAVRFWSVNQHCAARLLEDAPDGQTQKKRLHASAEMWISEPRNPAPHILSSGCTVSTKGGRKVSFWKFLPAVRDKFSMG